MSTPPVGGVPSIAITPFTRLVRWTAAFITLLDPVDQNNLEIANLLSRFVREKGLDQRGKGIRAPARTSRQPATDSQRPEPSW
jgi:hypothetical protein